MLPKNRVAVHPGEILEQEFLRPMKLTQATLSRKLRISKNRLNELIKGKRGMTAETALLLAKYFRNSPEFWMNLQTVHDLTKARAAQRRRGVAA